jgi:hypothetical protein
VTSPSPWTVQEIKNCGFLSVPWDGQKSAIFNLLHGPG